jgi:hypothetical protein
MENHRQPIPRRPHPPVSIMLCLMQINLYLQALNRRAAPQPTET